MRKVTVRALQNEPKSVLLALNRFFYILKPISAQAGLDLRTSEELIGYKIQSRVEKETP